MLLVELNHGRVEDPKNQKSVPAFLKLIENEQWRRDSFELLEIFSQVTKMPANLWGDSIIGFGEYHYKSERSNQEGDLFQRSFCAEKHGAKQSPP